MVTPLWKPLSSLFHGITEGAPVGRARQGATRTAIEPPPTVAAFSQEPEDYSAGVPGKRDRYKSSSLTIACCFVPVPLSNPSFYRGNDDYSPHRTRPRGQRGGRYVRRPPRGCRERRRFVTEATELPLAPLDERNHGRRELGHQLLGDLPSLLPSLRRLEGLDARSRLEIDDSVHRAVVELEPDEQALRLSL